MNMRRDFIIFILWQVTQVIDFAIGDNWGYSNDDQASWPEYFPQCGGKRQSPVVISASRAVELPLPALEMIGYHDFLPPKLQFTNNGHTVQMTVRGSKTKSDKNPFIFGAMLNKNESYILEGFHFHWGLKNSRGAEHVLHGTRYPMEMHLVHRNTKYQSMGDATQAEDGLAVVAVFFHLDEVDNERLGPLINLLPQVQKVHGSTYLNESLMLSWLLPENLDTYYTYRGSLTTPPCSEAVTWTVFADTVPISYKQITKFRLLLDDRSILADNFRQLQELGNRKIYVRRSSSFINKNDIINDLDVESLPWTK